MTSTLVVNEQRSMPVRRVSIPMSSPADMDRALEAPEFLALVSQRWTVGASMAVEQETGWTMILLMFPPVPHQISTQRLVTVVLLSALAVGIVAGFAAALIAT